eukprot:CAMPEP_0114533386 /NCGR_PEP_ID=MMETSP0109-20121206/27218_1 /TAXON_ID=29199 /ORGANISM="Chlorarachnion reptans, Strain CCCM449" /LENGTH=1030 /DNA_ID=CAMNT_0001716607 /DNA_START=32 /DNA_END=3125 /DNA_ORIENTATION=+
MRRGGNGYRRGNHHSNRFRGYGGRGQHRRRDGPSVIVRNLDPATTQEDLRRAFQGAGVEALSVRVTSQKERAFVELRSPEDVLRAVMRVTGSELRGRYLVVNRMGQKGSGREEGASVEGRHALPGAELRETTGSAAGRDGEVQRDGWPPLGDARQHDTDPPAGHEGGHGWDACSGADTFEFAKAFERVNSVEMDAKRYANLMHNLREVFGAPMEKVDVRNGDYTKLRHEFKQDALYLDPPWGGEDYRDFGKMTLALSGIEMRDLCVEMLQTDPAGEKPTGPCLRLIILKVPNNYDVDKFGQAVLTRMRPGEADVHVAFVRIPNMSFLVVKRGVAAEDFEQALRDLPYGRREGCRIRVLERSGGGGGGWAWKEIPRPKEFNALSEAIRMRRAKVSVQNSTTPGMVTADGPMDRQGRHLCDFAGYDLKWLAPKDFSTSANVSVALPGRPTPLEFGHAAHAALSRFVKRASRVMERAGGGSSAAGRGIEAFMDVYTLLERARARKAFAEEKEEEADGRDEKKQVATTVLSIGGCVFGAELVAFEHFWEVYYPDRPRPRLVRAIAHGTGGTEALLRGDERGSAQRRQAESLGNVDILEWDGEGPLAKSARPDYVLVTDHEHAAAPSRRLLQSMVEGEGEGGEGNGAGERLLLMSLSRGIEGEGEGEGRIRVTKLGPAELAQGSSRRTHFCVAAEGEPLAVGTSSPTLTFARRKANVRDYGAAGLGGGAGEGQTSKRMKLEADIQETKAHYDHHGRKVQTMRERAQGVAAPLKRFHNQVKRRLIMRFCGRRRGLRLLDLACGRGGDLHKWKAAGIAYVRGIDLSPAEIDTARRRYGESKNKFSRMKVDFEQSDHVGSGPVPGLNNQYDAVTCMFAAHYFFRDRNMLQNFLSNVSRALKPGGYFFGCAPDGKEVLKVLNQRKEYRSNVLHLKKEWQGNYKNFGSAFIFKILDTVTDGEVGSREFLVFSTCFRGMAKEHGLEPVYDYQDSQLEELLLPQDRKNFFKHFNPNYSREREGQGLEVVSRINMAFCFRKKT